MKPARKKSAARVKKPRSKPAAKEPIRVAVLESDPLRFVGFRALFGSQADFRIRSTTVPMILKALDNDVILMTTCRGTAFYSAMSALKAVRPSVRILVTGTGSRDEDVLRAISAGAKGYITEDACPADF
jgi:DNA-binding NarL/FixJ family response regulator